MSEMHEATLVGQPFPQFERFLDSHEAAALLQIHPKTLQRLARKGEIRGMRIGKLWRFRTSDLDVRQYTVVQPFANELHRCEPNPSNTRQYLPGFRVRRQSETSVRGPANREVR